MFWRRKLGLIPRVNTMSFRAKHKRYTKKILSRRSLNLLTRVGKNQEGLCGTIYSDQNALWFNFLFSVSSFHLTRKNYKCLYK